MPFQGDGSPMNRQPGAQFLKLCADQGDTEAKDVHGCFLLCESNNQLNNNLGVDYLSRALDHNWIPAQLASAEIFRRGHVIQRNRAQSAH
jgi:hypothetical protein